MVKAGNKRTSIDRHGFTLIEIMIVLTVIGLMAVIALPNIDLSRYRIESAMQGIGTTLMAAQRLAVTRQYDVIVTFDEATNAIIVHEDEDNDQTQDTGERVRRIPLEDQIVFGKGSAPPYGIGASAVNFTQKIGGKPVVIFHRNGAASEASGFYLTSVREANNGGHPRDTRAIEVDRATGRISWFRYGSQGWKRGF